MDTRGSFGKALRHLRKVRGLSQEDFSDVSSRTYVSTLERAMKSPTLDKIEALAGALGVHPLTLLTLAYAAKPDLAAVQRQLELVGRELGEVLAPVIRHRRKRR